MVSKKMGVIGAIFMFEGFMTILGAGLIGSIYGLPSLVYGLVKFGLGVYIGLCDENEE